MDPVILHKFSVRLRLLLLTVLPALAASGLTAGGMVWLGPSPLVAAAALLVALLPALLAARNLAGPLVALAAAVPRIAAGETGFTLPGRGRGDEIGTIALALETIQRDLAQSQMLQSTAASTAAVRERGQAAMQQHTQDFSESASAVMASLESAAQVMRMTAGDVSEAAERTRTGLSTVVTDAEDNAQNLATVAAAAVQLTETASRIADQVAHSSRSARDAVGQADAAGATLLDLSQSAGQIGEVVRLITDIAAKTNLLALNATIEAARAGEAGRGFSVVASEVKQLARQTAHATEQISTQVASIQSATGNAVEAMRGVGAAIGQIDEVAAAIAAAVTAQGSTARDIAGSVQNVADRNTSAIDALREALELAEQAGQASMGVIGAAEQNNLIAHSLHADVDYFLTALRSSQGEQRAWERVEAGGATVSVRPAEGVLISASLVDISRGGAMLACAARLEPGADIELELPAPGGSVHARVVRTDGQALALTFRQDPASLAKIDKVLARLGEAIGRAA